jgi:hypothetical protein
VDIDAFITYAVGIALVCWMIVRLSPRNRDADGEVRDGRG